MLTLITDQDNKYYALLPSKLKSVAGSRYVTRASVAKVLQGKTRHVVAGSAHPKAKHAWRAVATSTRMRIGCRKFTGQSFMALKTWALR